MEKETAIACERGEECGLYADVERLNRAIHGDDDDVEHHPGLIRRLDKALAWAKGATWAIMAAGALLMFQLAQMNGSIMELNKAIIHLAEQIKSPVAAGMMRQ